jgi:hypothetical protein
MSGLVRLRHVWERAHEGGLNFLLQLGCVGLTNDWNDFACFGCCFQRWCPARPPMGIQ